MRAFPAARTHDTVRSSIGDRAILLLVNMVSYLRHPVNVALFKARVGYLPNIALPARYNEKMLWRKIYDHNPSFRIFSDKLATKAFVARHCPEIRAPETLWAGDSPGDIPRELLGSPVIVKSNHGSDQNLFLDAGTDAEVLPVETIKGWLATTHGRRKLEWAYRFARKLIIVEEFITAPAGNPVVDVCVHAANGVALFIEVIADNKTGRQRKAYFRTDGTRWVDIERHRTADARDGSLPLDYVIPATFARAVALTERMSTGIDYARYDFLAAGDDLYAGEITVYPGSGLTKHAHYVAYNAHLTQHWSLLNTWFLSAPQHGPKRLYANALRRALHRQDGVSP